VSSKYDYPQDPRLCSYETAYGDVVKWTTRATGGQRSKLQSVA